MSGDSQTPLPPMRIPRVWFKRWGIKLGPLQITWRDLWSRSLGLEVAWRQHSMSVGFRGAPDV